MDLYNIIKQLGKGTYGTVHLCERKHNKQKIVVKQINTELEGEQLQAAKNEVLILKYLNHPNIIQYFDSFTKNATFYIVMEYASKGSIYELIYNRRPRYFSAQFVMNIFCQILMGLDHIHQKKVVHRDLKCENIFLTGLKSDVVKIGDFGISKTLLNNKMANTLIGTCNYMAPELCDGKPYNSKSDIWALGCILYELCAMEKMFEGTIKMSQIVRYIVDGYHDLMDNKSDPRVNEWFLMSSPFPTIAICLTYVYIVKVLGPNLMENRKPFELKNVLIVYNLFQVIFSTWLFYESCVAGWMNHYSFKCQPVDYSLDPLAMRMARGCWWYYISKFTEFFDTFFFVLRKKYDHVSTLHVIHHGIMPMSVWFGVKFTPGGHSSFFGFLNTFVHIIMYSYYLLAALGPQYQKYLWWKKYLTTIQMVQFVLVMVHAFQLLFIDCNYPKAFVWWIGMHAVMFYFLFSKFYKQTYTKKDKTLNVTENGKPQQNGKSKIGICFTSQTALYEHSSDVKSMSNGYTSSEATNKLRNRAYIDSNGAKA